MLLASLPVDALLGKTGGSGSWTEPGGQSVPCLADSCTSCFSGRNPGEGPLSIGPWVTTACCSHVSWAMRGTCRLPPVRRATGTWGSAGSTVSHWPPVLLANSGADHIRLGLLSTPAVRTLHTLAPLHALTFLLLRGQAGVVGRPCGHGGNSRSYFSPPAWSLLGLKL